MRAFGEFAGSPVMIGPIRSFGQPRRRQSSELNYV